MIAYTDTFLRSEKTEIIKYQVIMVSSHLSSFSKINMGIYTYSATRPSKHNAVAASDLIHQMVLEERLIPGKNVALLETIGQGKCLSI